MKTTSGNYESENGVITHLTEWVTINFYGYRNPELIKTIEDNLHMANIYLSVKHVCFENVAYMIMDSAIEIGKNEIQIYIEEE